jgi:hypothetical protein
MYQDRYGRAWDADEDRRRYLVWERAVLGAAITRGKKPRSHSPGSRFAREHKLGETVKYVPPLTAIPDEALDHWQKIAQAVLDHHGIPTLRTVVDGGRKPELVACAHEIAYWLMTVGHHGGRALTSHGVARILGRHYSTILYGVHQHGLRLREHLSDMPQ